MANAFVLQRRPAETNRLDPKYQSRARLTCTNVVYVRFVYISHEPCGFSTFSIAVVAHVTLHDVLRELCNIVSTTQ